MIIRCPHCHSAVDTDGQLDTPHVNCASCGGAVDLSATTKSHWTSKKLIGHFELLDQLGIGGYGSVWKARDSKLDRIVAIKLPRFDQTDLHAADLFIREARAAAQLRHPGIVAVHEIGHESDTLYIVSDFVEGITLADRLTTGPCEAREAAKLLAQIAYAVSHAHNAGVVHRDLKPSNIMLDVGGRPYILDFGLARRESGEATITVEGKIIGTAAYMSPEQARGEGHHVDQRTDIYSLGVVLFELITGERPFRGNVRMLLHQVIHEDPPNPRRLNNSVPKDLETICMKCLEKEPQRRYHTAADLAADLEKWLRGDPISARPVYMTERLWRWYWRSGNAAMVMAGILTIANSFIFTGWGLVGIIFILSGIHPLRSPLRGVTELLAVIVLYYIPWTVIGICTLNGNKMALFLGTVISLISLVNCAMMMAGISPTLHLATLQEAQSNVYVRFQLSSLLALTTTTLFAANVIAVIPNLKSRS